MAGAFKEKIKQDLYNLNSGPRRELLALSLRFLLYVCSLIYGVLLKFRFYLYQWHILPQYYPRMKVISVGNITVGGSGKTPAVALIARFLVAQQRNIAVISRGYHATRTAQGIIADEPEMLKKQLPGVRVIVEKDRIKALKDLAKNTDCEAVILDDAFQNCRIKKTLDLVCINARDPFGQGHLLPRGLLRLPLVYLKRADIFLITHSDYAPRELDALIRTLRRYNRKAEIFKSRHVPEYIYDFFSGCRNSAQSLCGKKIAALCAIARAGNFHETLSVLGAELTRKFDFPDHHLFTGQEWDQIREECLVAGIDTIVITAKDEPRLRLILSGENKDIKLIVLQVSMRLEEDEERFFAGISAVLAD